MGVSNDRLFGQEARLQVRLFGAFAIVADGCPLVVPARKDRWLLALLFLADGACRERNQLQSALWSCSDARDSTYNLRRSLSSLRKALGEHAYRLQSPAPEALRFDLNDAFVDALAFDHEPEDALAVALYAGPFLPDCDEAWAVAERQTRHLRFQQRLVRLAEARLPRGDLDALPSLLLHALALDPLWEEGRRLWMRVQVALGQPHAALASYQELGQQLQKSDPRLQPEEETTALWRQVRDQMRKGDRPAAAPSPVSVGSSLPVSLTRLIGREREIGEVLDRVGASRLVTLTGSGGCGKTRLGIEAARRLAPSFSEGAVWVELAPLLRGELVAPTVAQALSMKEGAGESIEAALVRALSSRHLLLVMDNCEHLLESTASLLESLLRQCPSLSVLATSRERLNLAGEVSYRVPSLSIPPPGCSSEALYDYESSCLFLERARALGWEVGVSAAGAAVLSSLCARLDGIPLAIELAGARVRSLGLEELDRRLTDRFAVLTGGSRDAPARHQTLRALTQWSFDLLNASEQALFVRLSVFAGGWTLEAAESVCVGGLVEAGAVVSLLASLVDKCLAEVMDSGSGRVRYRFLETVRQFGLERLSASGEEEWVRDRHLEFFLARAEAPRVRCWALMDEPEVISWLDAMERDHDNLRAALAHARKRPQTCLMLAAALGYFWHPRGHYREGRDHLMAALERADPEDRSPVRAHALLRAGGLSHYQADDQTAVPLLEEALTLFREQGDRAGVARVLYALSEVALFRGDFPAAQSLIAQSLAIYRELEDHGAASTTLNLLSLFTLFVYDLVQARALLEESRALWSGPPPDLLQGSEGMLLLEEGDPGAALTCFEDALVQKRAGGNPFEIGGVQIEMGYALQELGECARARERLTESLGICQELNEIWSVARCLDAFAALAWRETGSDRAPRLWGAAAAVRGTIVTQWFPLEQARFRRYSAPAREALGEAAFAAAYEEGRRMSVEEAVQYALAGKP